MLNIYRASAGAGKTYTLAYQYIKMLLGRQLEEKRHIYRLNRRRSNRHRSILAITFTNKATEEMKARILHQLAVLAGREPGWSKASPYAARLMQELGTSAEELREEASRALDELLFDYGFFAVSTIDSFFQQVLRTFAREADLTGNFELDLDNDAFYNMAVARLLRYIDYPDDRETGRRMAIWLQRFLSVQLHEGKSIALFNRQGYIFSSLTSFIGNVLDETFSAHEEEMMAFFDDPDNIGRITTAIDNAIATATENITTRCAEMAAVLENSGCPHTHALSGFRNYSSLPFPPQASTTLPKLVDNPDKAFTKGKSKPEKERHAALVADTALMERISDAAQLWVDSMRTLAEARALRDNIFYLGLLGDLLRQMTAMRLENNTLLLSDTNGILEKIIGDTDTPFIYERMGVWLEHFLIDEFQDTSRLQWKNMLPLLREELSKGLDNLIIGDEKQSIYRFRSADPTLLQHKVDRDLDGFVADGSDGLATNWRSSRIVVEFNNSFFTKAVETPAAGALAADVYRNTVQNVSPANVDLPGYVEFNLINGAADDDGGTIVTDPAFRNMALAIQRQLAPERGGYRPADIAILTRGKAEAADAIEYLLRCQAGEEGYPELPPFNIISDDSIRVGTSHAVKLVISGLKALLLQRPGEEAVAEAEERRAHSRTLGLDILARMVNDFEYARHSGDEPSVALDKAVRLALAPDGEADECGGETPRGVDTAMKCPNITTLTDRFIRALLDSETIAREHLFVASLQDIVADYADKHGSDLQGFIEWWENKGCKTPVAVPESADSLRVMTVHKAKGLEFKCVHIPKANWNMTKTDSVTWFATPAGGIGFLGDVELPPIVPLVPSSKLRDTVFGPQYEQIVNEHRLDELNILYVAFTRAVNELIVSYDKKTGPGVSSDGITGHLIQETLGSLGSSSGNFTAGQPTRAVAGKARETMALEPTGKVTIAAMPPAERDTLWSSTSLDSRRDKPLEQALRGVMLHDVLSQVTTVGSLPRAVRRMVSQGVVPYGEERAVTELLAQSLSRPEVSQWFEGFRRVITERTIAMGQGEERSNWRPDRVVWTADGYIDVIDYKTGEENRRQHTRQVADYMRHLRSLGYRNVRGFVWYLDPHNIVTVD